MKSEVIYKPTKNPKYKTRELVIYLDEDIFNDPAYNINGEKREKLIEEAKKLINANIDSLRPYESSGILFDSTLCFNIENVPDQVTNTDKGPNNAIFQLFVDITVYSVEKVLGTKIEHKGRKWFIKKGAPHPHVEAEGCAEGIKEALGNDDCWGCKGISLHTGDTKLDNPTSCPLF